MFKWSSVIFLALLALFLFWQWETVSELRGENISYFTQEIFPETGYGILTVTIPLLIAQNVFTVFPVIIIITIHVLLFGFWEGLLFSFAGTTAGAGFCFLLARSWSEEKVKNFWSGKKDRWEKAASLLERHGMAAVVVLRSIPIMPSNLISAAAALTPMKVSEYMWGTAAGNISMIWILSLIAAPFWAERNEFITSLLLYLIFLTVTAVIYWSVRLRRKEAV
ncbi:MAG: TVP38/TMEM64 family protein [Alkalicoccus sp.]|nr:MAG: TVP38/TMEM64 family protein [Alkalicoccus sp.]